MDLCYWRYSREFKMIISIKWKILVNSLDSNKMICVDYRKKELLGLLIDGYFLVIVNVLFGYKFLNIMIVL